MLSKKVHVVSFKKLDNPTQDETSRSYISVLNIKQLPLEIGNPEWVKINPRDPKMNSEASREMATTLEENAKAFFLKNRGLLIFAKNVRYDNKTQEIFFNFEDDELHGLGDGRHTFSVIKNYLNDKPDFEEAAFVRMEIIEGIKDPQEIIAIVDARNTAKEVATESIFDLKGKFNVIKTALQICDYKDDVSYKEYEVYPSEHLESGKKKPISIRLLIKILTAFNPECGIGSPFLYSYTSAEKALEDYGSDQREKMYHALAGLMPLMLELYDLIRLEIPETFSDKERKELKIRNNRSSSECLRFMKSRTDKLKYKLPQGYIFPILSAFRFLLIKNRNGYNFSVKPKDVFMKSKSEISSHLFSAAKRNGFNPNGAGKDEGLWTTLGVVVQKNMK